MIVLNENTYEYIGDTHSDFFDSETTQLILKEIDVVYKYQDNNWHLYNATNALLEYPIIDTNMENFNKAKDINKIITILLLHTITEEEKQKEEEQFAQSQQYEEDMKKAPEQIKELQSVQDDIVLFLADVIGNAL